MQDQLYATTASEVSGPALARLIRELVRSAPYGLAPSRVWLSAAVPSRLGPLSDAEEQRVLVSITELVRGRRYRLEPEALTSSGAMISGLVGVVDWGLVRGLEGPPIVMGSEEWLYRVVSEMVALLKPLLDHGTPEVRRALLEDQLEEALRALGFEVERGRRTRASDLWVRVGGIWINVECRNRVWAVLDRLESRDRKIFRDVAADGHPSLLVTGAVTHRGRQRVDGLTSDLGPVAGVAELGCCVLRSGDDVERLSGWAAMAGRSLGTRLPDTAVFAVADGLERVAARVRGAESHHVASNLVDMASRASWSEAARLVEVGASGGDTEAVVLPFPRRVRLSDADLVEAAREYRAAHPGAVRVRQPMRSALGMTGCGMCGVGWLVRGGTVLVDGVSRPMSTLRLSALAGDRVGMGSRDL